MKMHYKMKYRIIGLLVMLFCFLGCNKKNISHKRYLTKKELIQHVFAVPDYSKVKMEVRLSFSGGPPSTNSMKTFVIARKYQDDSYYGVMYGNSFRRKKDKILLHKNEQTYDLGALFHAFELNKISALPNKINHDIIYADGTRGSIAIMDGYVYKIEVFQDSFSKSYSYHCPQTHADFYDPNGNTRRVINILEEILAQFKIQHELC